MPAKKPRKKTTKKTTTQTADMPGLIFNSVTEAPLKNDPPDELRNSADDLKNKISQRYVHNQRANQWLFGSLALFFIIIGALWIWQFKIQISTITKKSATPKPTNWNQMIAATEVEQNAKQQVKAALANLGNLLATPSNTVSTTITTTIATDTPK